MFSNSRLRKKYVFTRTYSICTPVTVNIDILLSVILYIALTRERLCRTSRVIPVLRDSEHQHESIRKWVKSAEIGDEKGDEREVHACHVIGQLMTGRRRGNANTIQVF